MREYHFLPVYCCSSLDFDADSRCDVFTSGVSLLVTGLVHRLSSPECSSAGRPFVVATRQSVFPLAVTGVFAVRVFFFCGLFPFFCQIHSFRAVLPIYCFSRRFLLHLFPFVYVSSSFCFI
ncbi:unnamed protein product [Cuscuta epithymum]|uniref:Transmembrane protein n=1 Tax=Cuscuta epithymum TaxID=186058 RepID=A0AAV0DBR5_9ASTE|nr:unnamed protein product [Cuscuta epithymum]